MSETPEIPDNIRLPAGLLLPLAAGQARLNALNAAETVLVALGADGITLVALREERAQLAQQSTNLLTAYVMGLGIDPDRARFNLDLAEGRLVRALPMPAEPAAAGAEGERP